MSRACSILITIKVFLVNTFAWSLLNTLVMNEFHVYHITFYFLLCKHPNSGPGCGIIVASRSYTIRNTHTHTHTR
jgi:mannitol-specific phosphotransferase system IIBC component